MPALARRLAAGRGSETTLPWAASALAVLALAVLLGASIMLSAARTYSPFIYFRF